MRKIWWLIAAGVLVLLLIFFLYIMYGYVPSERVLDLSNLPASPSSVGGP